MGSSSSRVQNAATSKHTAFPHSLLRLSSRLVYNVKPQTGHSVSQSTLLYHISDSRVTVMSTLRILILILAQLTVVITIPPGFGERIPLSPSCSTGWRLEIQLEVVG